MIRERWSAVQAVVDRVLDLPSTERERVLLEYRSDTGLLEEVRRMLAQIDQVTSWLEQPPFQPHGRSGAVQDEPRLSAGETIGGRFQIVCLLGRGGMGEVYEAIDAAAVDKGPESHVALKTLRASLYNDSRALVRFRQELFQARRITHPNACRLHEIFFERDAAGLPLLFFTMELLRGEPLSHRLRAGRVPPIEALFFLRQVAAGLDAAHDARIVHRDVKPGNIIIDTAGRTPRAVITDFGLALSQTRAGEPTGPLIGTPAYMAPEQLRGEPATTASDIYSFGIIASELLFGCRPEGIPESLPAPRQRAWRAAIRKCTSADPGARLPTAGALMDDIEPARKSRIPRRVAVAAALAGTGILAWVSGSRSLNSTRLAVLPVDSTQSSDEHIQSALTNLLIAGFRRFPGFEVPGPSTVRGLARRTLPTRDIARKLEVEWLLVSTLEVNTNRFVLRARLLRADGAAGPWQGQMEGGLESLEAIAAQVASQTASAIRPSLGQAGSPTPPRWRNPDAYDTYLQARYLFNRRQRDDLHEARRLAERAIQLDPDAALGYCVLADTLCVLGDYSQAPPAEVLPLAKQAAVRALTLNADLADSNVAFAFATTLNDFDWHSADRSYRRALELDPHHPQAHQWYAELLAKLQRPEECVRHAREAVTLDSASVPIQRNLGTMFYMLRRYSEAIQQANFVMSLSPGFFGCRELLAESHARLGDRKGALDLLPQITADPRTPGFSLAYAATTYAILGMAKETQEAIDLLTGHHPEGFQPVHVARAFADLGKRAECLRWLEIAYSRRDTGLQLLPFHHSFDQVRSYADVRNLIERLRIVYPPA